MPDTTEISYLIDAVGRRIGKKVNGTVERKYLYQDQINPVAEYDASGGMVAYYVYATRGHVPDYMVRSGETYRIISDHLGSVRMVVNTADSTVAQRMDFDEFGNVLTDTNPGFQPFGFAGGLYDPDTQLTRFGYRDYDPETGRWQAKDPIGFGGGQVNLYLFCYADPINYVDPSGLGAQNTGAEIVYSPTLWDTAYHAYIRTENFERGRFGSSWIASDDGVSDEIAYTVSIALPAGMSVTEFERSIADFEGWNSGFYIPFFNDCHTSVENALNHAGVAMPVEHNRTWIDDAFFRIWSSLNSGMLNYYSNGRIR